MKQLAVIGLCLVLVTLTSQVWADGCYFPERAVLRLPEITAQRAVLRWKDDTETLLISSALSSEAQKLGWIIPLPSVPDRIEKADPGGLKTLALLVQPKIVHDVSQEVRAIAVVVILGCIVTAIALFKPSRLLDLLVLILLGSIFSTMFLSAGSRGVEAGRAVVVEKTARVGAYEIVILRPKTSADLSAWLTANGYATIPDVATTTVTEYIEDGWVFTAIRLVRKDAGANSPHPIRIEFRTEQPVYPMRLTSIAANDLSLDLFVIAGSRATANGFQTVFCDQLIRTSLDHFVGRTHQTSLVYTAKNSSVKIGHPDICDLLWDGCVLTQLSTTLSTASMRDDVRIGFTQFRAYQRQLYSERGARAVSIAIFTISMGAFSIISMIIWQKRLREPGGKRRYFFTLCLPAAVGCLALGAAANGLLPKVHPDEITTFGRAPYIAFYARDDLQKVLVENPSVLQKDEDEIASRLLRALSDIFRPHYRPPINQLTGEEFANKSTPGNLTVKKQGDKVLIRFYDSIGSPLTVETNETPHSR